MLNQAELVFGRYNSGQRAPIGSYWNPRTNAIFQQASDGPLPNSGTWCFVTTSGTSTLAQCATAINNGLGRSDFAAASLHTYSSPTDDITVPGQMTTDA
ncbi:MAG TPA: hypothetical protein VFN35_35135 [Ktedonobacteraceae bacterium]|nr:hypothetical protein [Ktedonobacteraceae bacterium]